MTEILLVQGMVSHVLILGVLILKFIYAWCSAIVSSKKNRDLIQRSLLYECMFAGEIKTFKYYV
jgi:hypothetical protein